MTGERAFELDTSGEVVCPVSSPGNNVVFHWVWGNLSPFEQGYVEALFASGVAMYPNDHFMRTLPEGRKPWAFSDLHPETLEAIRKDCAAWLARHRWIDRAESGETFWRYRGLRTFPGRRFGYREMIPFPPLTPSLDNEGKVRLQAAGGGS